MNNSLESFDNPLQSFDKPFVSSGGVCYNSKDYTKYWDGEGGYDDNYGLSYETSGGSNKKKNNLLKKSKNTLIKLTNKSYQLTKSVADVPMEIYDELLNIVQTVLDDAKGLADYIINMAKLKGGGKKDNLGNKAIKKVNDKIKNIMKELKSIKKDLISSTKNLTNNVTNIGKSVYLLDPLKTTSAILKLTSQLIKTGTHLPASVLKSTGTIASNLISGGATGLPSRFYNENAPKYIGGEKMNPPPDGYQPLAQPHTNLMPYNPYASGGSDWQTEEQINVNKKRSGYRVGNNPLLTTTLGGFEDKSSQLGNRTNQMNTQAGGLKYLQTNNFDITASLGAPNSPRWNNYEIQSLNNMPKCGGRPKGSTTKKKTSVKKPVKRGRPKKNPSVKKQVKGGRPKKKAV
jgi:hypothetical protein